MIGRRRSSAVVGVSGTIAYISPEQTGRINRGVDTRSDLYSLGVTFFEMLTGRLPFRSESALEVVHGHIAKVPPRVAELVPGCPSTLSRMVERLLAKNPEDRYQSAVGLLADLRRCLLELERTGKISDFELGHEDARPDHVAARRLYGRRDATHTVQGAVDRAREGGRELLVISGAPGVGKSVLLQDLSRDASLTRGVFIAGKLGQYHRGRPLLALTEAFEDLAQQLLVLPQAELDSWARKILTAPGANVSVITDTLPAFRDVVGRFAAPTVLDQGEAQSRLQYAFHAFVKVFCRPGAPLVLVLDDVQWIDHATTSLLETLLGDTTVSHLLVVATMRDNEVTEASLFPRAIARIEPLGVSVTRIHLDSLPVEAVAALLGDAYVSTRDRVAPLAALVHAQTLGNPFFVHQFVAHLRDVGALRFDTAAGRWEWDIQQIQHLDITDNVVDFIAARVRDLSAGCQHLLKSAACLGSRFSLGALRQAGLLVEQNADDLLTEAVAASLIIPINLRSAEGRRPISVSPRPHHGPSYRFRHDRVQQAAYSLIPETERPQIHLRIGRGMLAALGAAGLGDTIFDVVEHLQLGAGLLVDPAERTQLRALHALAARRALDALAFSAALDHVDQAWAAVNGDLWEEDHALALELHTVGASAAVMLEATERMQRDCLAVLARAPDVYERLPVYTILINHHFASSEEVPRALELALDALAGLGLHLPRQPNSAQVAWALLRTMVALRGRGPAALSTLPPMTDRRVLAIMRLLVQTDGVAYMANPNAFALFVLTGVQLSLRHGHCSASGWAYNLYGAILAAALGNIDGGGAFGRFGLELARREQDAWMEVRITAPYHITVAHWSLPHQEMVSPLQLAIERALALGANNPAGANLMYLQFYRFFGGVALDALAGEQREAIRLARALSQNIAVDFTGLWLQVARLLRGEAGPSPDNLGSGELERFTAAGNKNGVFTVSLARAVTALYLGEIGDALRHSDIASADEGSAEGTILGIQHMFYRAVILAAAADSSPRRATLRREARRRLGKLRTWQRHNAHNFSHKADLVEAELHRLAGRHTEAAVTFDRAHRAAIEAGMVHEAGLIAERAAAHFRSLGISAPAEAWLADARYDYTRWGAARAVFRLGGGPLLIPEVPRGPDRASGRMKTLDTLDGNVLDVASIVASADAILREMDLRRLLATVMKTTVENAGAERGVLLMDTPAGLQVEARHPGVVGDPGPDYAQSIVDYARRTRRHVVLEDARSHGHFVADPYVRLAASRSVCCVPLVNQQELIGVVYLENSLASGVFTPGRIGLLTVLAAQAAISIRNVRLYTAQVGLTEAYSRFVPQEFLKQLGRESILDVRLGDQVERHMAAMFADVRSFTTLTDGYTPQATFAFLNEFLSELSPVIRQHGGFIDKYIGDAIMALFPNGAEDATRAAIAIHASLYRMNKRRSAEGNPTIAIGVGIHAGRLMLGTIGEPARMEGTVISEAVNIASRVEELTKSFGAKVLVTEAVFDGLLTFEGWNTRYLGRVPIRGKRAMIGIYELLDAEVDDAREQRLATRDRLQSAILSLEAGQIRDAEVAFAALVAEYPEDRALESLLAAARSSHRGSVP